jgi:hypothetical protein
MAATIGTERGEDAEARHVEVARDVNGESIQQPVRGRRG